MKTVRVKSRKVAETLSVLCDDQVAAEQRLDDSRQERREVAEALVEWYLAREFAPRPTSALLNGSAAERRRRRIERRAVVGLVRSFPATQPAMDEEEVAS